MECLQTSGDQKICGKGMFGKYEERRRTGSRRRKRLLVVVGGPLSWRFASLLTCPNRVSGVGDDEGGVGDLSGAGDHVLLVCHTGQLCESHCPLIRGDEHYDVM